MKTTELTMRLITFSLIALGFATPALSNPAKNTKIPDSTKVALVKTFVANSLKDPEAARFRGVKLKWENVCGEVNAKNGYGAYVGYRRFYAIDAVDVHMEGSRFSEEQWDRFCGPNAKKPEPPAAYHEQWMSSQ